MRIHQIEVSNVLKIKDVTAKFDPHFQVVGGRNAQGKSSLIQAIWLALGGGNASKETVLPIRHGETKASVVLDLGDLIVTRSWTAKGTRLTVKTPEGAGFTSPQAQLDKLMGKFSFDPLAFTRLSAREQRELLISLVDMPVDIHELDKERAALYQERLETGRRRDAFGTVTVNPNLPAELVSSAAILADIRELEARNKARTHAQWELMAQQSEKNAVKERVERLRRELAEAETRLAHIGGRVEEAEKLVCDLGEEQEDPRSLHMQLEGVEETNALIRENNQARERREEQSLLGDAYAKLNQELHELDEIRRSALEGASFPVPGLGFSDDGVTFNGVPFSQASSAEKIRVSFAIGASMDPDLRVMRILDGSLLDDDSMAILREMAAGHDYQLVVERVGSGDEGALILEDGELV